MSDRKFPISSLDSNTLDESLSFLSPRDRLSFAKADKESKQRVDNAPVWRNDAKKYFRSTIKPCPSAKEQYHLLHKEAILQFKARFIESHHLLNEEHPFYNRLKELLRPINGNWWVLNIYMGALGYTKYDMLNMSNRELLERNTEAEELMRECERSPELRNFFVDTISIQYPYFRILYNRALDRALSEGYDISTESNTEMIGRYRVTRISPEFGRILFETGLGREVPAGTQIDDFLEEVNNGFLAGVLQRHN